MSNAKSKRPSDPMIEDEILDALAASGYPLEIRLMKAFSEGGMDPIIGFRVPGNGPESREIDIIAHFSKNLAIGDGRVFTVTLRLLIEAKSLEPGAAFLGFPWSRPSDHELRVGRARFGGSPTYRVLDAYEEDNGSILGAGGLAEAFDALNAGPVCAQWAVVRRTKSGAEQRPVASHDDPFWRGIDGVVRASSILMTEHSTYTRWPKDSFQILFELPVLIVATPHLWLHDATAPVASSLSRTPSLLLTRMFQVEARVEPRLVDIVSENAVPDFISACRSTIRELEKRLKRHAPTLADIAQRQRSELEEAELREVAREFRSSGLP